MKNATSLYTDFHVFFLLESMCFFLSFFFFFYFDRQEVDRMLVRDTSGELRGLSRIDVNLLKCSVLSCLF